MNRALSFLPYPLVLGGAVIGFQHALSAGLAPAWAAYGVVAIAAFTVVALEILLPEHREWRPARKELLTDATFMALVQIALPRLLSAMFAAALIAWGQSHVHASLWPTQLPIAMQLLGMILIIEFFRYWLHRAAHRFLPLWRLHEVHHSPERLYALNVGRFHPIEKTLHFCIDTAPFLLAGARVEVLAWYFVVYSVNGSLQHSNVRLRHGWLNYIVGSAETHRWHHARDPKLASCNFGSTTVVWDIVFGTWYLPAGTMPQDLGIPNRAYPRGFWAQLAAPFRVRRASRKGWFSRAGEFSMRAHLWILRARSSWRVACQARNPMRTQRRVLRRIVRKGRGTQFGRDHKFEEICDYVDFAQRVPVSQYEDLRPYIEKQVAQGTPELNGEPPRWYARTSGTTGKPKDLPLTPSHLRGLRRIAKSAVAFQYRTCPEAFRGGILVIVSPAMEGTMDNGCSYGSASGIVAGNTPALVRGKFVVPPCVFGVADSRVKNLLILQLALARPDITYAGAANPTTLLNLLRIFQLHRQELLDGLGEGRFWLADQLSPEVRAAVAARLVPMPKRAGHLREQAGKAELRVADLWPELRLVVGWTCASAAIAMRALRKELQASIRVLELGYVASEFRGTITLGRRAGSGWPSLDTHFFEFVERDRWDRGAPEFLTLDQLRRHVDYYVVVTTPSGFYRYFINDIVRVRGFLGRVPLLQFRQKGKGVTNITGEKLYESQVLESVRAVAEEHGIVARFLVMLADEECCRYRLYIEADSQNHPDPAVFARAVDEQICRRNVEYRAKRESERLPCLQVTWLRPEAGEEYKRHCVQAGQREGQFKVLALQYRRDFSFDIDAHMEARP